MRPFGNQPRPDEIEQLIDEEEQDVISREGIRDAEKSEVAGRLEAWREADLEAAAGDEPIP